MNELRKIEHGLGWPLMASANQNGASHFAFPSGLRPRFLLPVDKSVARLGLEFFLPPLKRLALNYQAFTARLLSANERSMFSQTSLMEEIQELLNEPGLQAVVALGTPGPYSKATVLFLSRTLTPLAIAKVGATKAGVALVKNEADWLTSLAAKSGISTSIPKLIARRQIGNTYILVQSIGMGKQLGYAFTNMHLTFLSHLQDCSESRSTFAMSEMRRQMERRMMGVEANLSQEWRQRAKHAFHEVDKRLGGVRLPTVCAHRDFVPWNIRLADSKLFIFDWEYASHGYLPLYDLFHFLLMPVALKRNISQNQLRKLISEAGAIGLQLNSGKQKTLAAAAQLLAYLTDLCLFYLESNNGDDTDDIVVQRYASLIDVLLERC